MTVSRVSSLAALLAISIAALPASSRAQEQAANAASDPMTILRTESYIRPPADFERMLLAPRVDISFNTPSPDRSWFVRFVGPVRGDIKDRAKPHIILGGMGIDTRASRLRTFTTTPTVGMTLVNPRTGASKTIETPRGATVFAPAWSPNGTQIAYVASFDDASHVFVADVATGKSTQVTRSPLMLTLTSDIDFTPDGKSLIVTLIPDGRGPAPVHGPNGTEESPTVRLTESRVVPQPVFASLLLDPHDKALLKHYTVAQLALINVQSKAVTKIGTPKMISAVDASPDGKYLTVTQMTEPFSYLVPVSNFGSVREVWDMTGKTIATLTTTKLREERPNPADDAPGGFGGGAANSDTGKRNIEWNPVGPGLTYVESVFGPRTGNGAPGAGRGRGGNGANARPQPTSVRFMSWLPPFGPNDTKLIYEGGPQLGATAYSQDGKLLFVSDSGGVFALRFADGKRFNLGRGVALQRAGGGGFGGGGGGRANADSATGGTLVTKSLPGGMRFVVVGNDGKTVGTLGNRAPGANWSTQAPRPWLDKLDIETGQRSRVLDSPADAYDSFVATLDDNFSQIMYTHESATIVPDVYLKDVASNAARKITSNVDVNPGISRAQVKRFQVTRPRDGHQLWVDVTLPRDWRPGQRLPGVIWFYPREYTSQVDYERTRYSTNINHFADPPSPRPASAPKVWVTQGYAVIEPDIPIWGDSGKMNDNYTRDLKENLDAVVNAAVDAGYLDRDRLGIGGHSYGAFSTVNAMTLVPYFKAGIAGDGMYNRSLTPFGFQSERRNFYQAQETYLDMSPFLRADKLAGALLMYHGGEDQNTGTSIISSQRMMMAMQGLGKPAALYIYPYEDHGTATYASELDLWGRALAWFDMYVKNPKVEKKPVP